MNSPSLRFAVQIEGRIEWRLARNCSVTPKQLCAFFASLCVVSVVISVGFWLNGATLVAPFAMLELVVVGIALLVYARHATDCEHLVLDGAHLQVQIELAGHRTQAAFERQWVQVHKPVAGSDLIQLCSQGQTLQVGRHVRPELRAALAAEISRALRAI